MRHLLSVIVCSLFVLYGPSGCIDDPELKSGVHNAEAPTVGDLIINGKDKTASTVTLKSSVLKANGYPVTGRGFVWNTDSVIPTGDEKDKWQPVGEGIGEYTDTIKNLSPGVLYYFWSYATNEIDTKYSDFDPTSTDDGLGQLEIYVPEEHIHATRAIASGKITLKGEGETKSRGIYYAEIDDWENKITVPSKTSLELDSFVCELSGLKPEREYVVQAFVTNEISGTAVTTLNDTLHFPTGDGKPVVEKELYIVPGYDNVYAKSSIVSQGDAPLDERGFCWSTTEEPTIDDNIKPVGKEEGEFSANIEDLIPEQKYYIRAYGKNKFGTSYSDPQEFSMLRDLPTLQTLDPSSDYDAGEVYVDGLIDAHGKSDVKYKGFCFSSREKFPDLSNTNVNEKVYISTTEDNFSYTISGLKGGTKYYIRAFATNDEGTSYGAVKEITTPDILKVSSDEFGGSARLSGSSAYFVIGDKGYLLGGDAGDLYTNELYNYDVFTQSWYKSRPYPKAAKWQAVAVYKNKAFALGGRGADNKPLDNFYQYNAGLANVWSNMPGGPDSAYFRVGVTLGDAAYFIGGMGVRDSVKDEVWRYAFIPEVWVRQPDFPVKQYGGIALNIADELYAGMGKDTLSNCNKTIWKLALGSSTWIQETENSLISGGGILAAATYNNKIYLIDESFYIHEYDILSKTWTRKSRINGNDRDVHGMFTIEEKLYIGLIGNKMYQYNPLWDNED